MKKQELSSLVTWSTQYASLPWRLNRSLYGTLVSEIMLQQTTVPTVLGHFESFMLQFPNLNKLAKASEDQLLVAWKGLGYYRRARHLLAAAKVFSKKHKGEIPLDFELLQTIDGIGDYTACALLAIGANQNLLCIDANLERVLSRYYAIEKEKGIPLKKEIKRGFSQGEYLSSLSFFGGQKVNEALMDLGREICLAKKPRCSLCPLAKNCRALADSTISIFPVLSKAQQKKKKEKPLKLSLLRIILKEGEELWAYKKEKGQWLEGHFEIPTFVLECEDPNFKQYPPLPQEFTPKSWKELASYSTIITKYKITNYIFYPSPSIWKKIRMLGDYCAIGAQEQKKLSTASLKAINS